MAVNINININVNGFCVECGNPKRVDEACPVCSGEVFDMKPQEVIRYGPSGQLVVEYETPRRSITAKTGTLGEQLLKVREGNNGQSTSRAPWADR